MGTLTKLFLKLLKVLWHWFALCLELLDFACHAFHVQELCNAVINLHKKDIQRDGLKIMGKAVTAATPWQILDIPQTHCTLLVLRPFV